MNAQEKIFGPLNPAQKKAVETLEGPLLILAGAGSGKTRALTHRIANLIDHGVPPWQILAVTFTNKAAKEMKERITGLLKITDAGKENSLPTIGTFHSVCVRMLRRDIEHIGRERNFVIYDSEDQKRLMKSVLQDLHIAEEELKPKAALGHVGRFKSEAITPKEVEADATTPLTQLVARAYKHYQAKLREANALDFDDLILETVRLLHEVPSVLERYQNTWKFLHVDEYQDTNHAQYLLISLLAKRDHNICVIGDPDQSIYAFRGADIRNILEFQTEYKDAKSIKLEQNYRSTNIILNAADAVIAENPNRPEKNMWTERKGGAKVVLQEVEDEKAEAKNVVERALEHRKNGIGLNEQVVLYRTNAQSRLFEEMCMRLGVPYRIIGGVKFYARKEVKDVLAYLLTIMNPNDAVSLLRIINIPARKIGKTTIEKLQAYANANAITLWKALGRIDEIPDLNEPTRDRLAQFVLMIDDLRETAKQETVGTLIRTVLIKSHMEKWVRDNTEEGEARWENILELLNVAQKYDHLEPSISLTSFLEEVALVSEVDKLQETDNDALTLMTVHLCKGLEFSVVSIVGCEDGLLPHGSSLIDREQMEEERRLMYVAMTRAKDHLHLLYAQSRMMWGKTESNPRSRFLDDIPHELTDLQSNSLLSSNAWHRTSAPAKTTAWEDDDFNQDLPDVSEGTRIAHPHFGEGRIVSLQGDIAEIAFDSGQTKRLALNIAPIQVL